MIAVAKPLEVYYEKGSVIVRDACASDIDYLKNHLKHSDIEEMWASHNKFPFEALKESFDNSSQCLSVVNEGRAIAMFGIVPFSETESVIWFLSSEELFQVRRFDFIRHSAGFVGFMFNRAPSTQKLFNWVDSRNTASIRWLKKIGAELSDAKPFGAEQIPFHYFEFHRRD